MKIITSMIALVLLSGCSLSPFYSQVRASIDQAVEQAVEDRMHYNDQKGETILKLPCDLSVGAYYRLENPNHQKAVDLLCKPAGQTLSKTE